MTVMTPEIPKTATHVNNNNMAITECIELECCYPGADWPCLLLGNVRWAGRV